MKEKLWTKNFILLSTIFFLSALVFYLLIVTIGNYAIDEFKATTGMAGLVSGIFIIGAFIGRLATGRLIVKVGSKKMFFYGLIAFIATTALYFVEINLAFLTMIRVLHGIALGIVLNATGTIIAETLPNSRRGEGIGYYSMSSILSAAVGPFIGILLIQNFDFTYIFILNLILSVLAFSLYFFTNIPVEHTEQVDTQIAGFKLSNYLEVRAMPIAIVALFVGFSYSGIMSFLSLYAEEINLINAASFFFLVYAIAILLSRPFTGRMMDAKGENIIVYPSLIIFALGMTLFSLASNGFALLLAAVLIGLGYGNFNSIAQTIAIKVTPVERLGLATSTYFVFFDFGLGIGPYFLGLLVPYIGYRMVFLLMVFIIIFSFALYYVLHGKKQAHIERKEALT